MINTVIGIAMLITFGLIVLLTEVIILNFAVLFEYPIIKWIVFLGGNACFSLILTALLTIYGVI